VVPINYKIKPSSINKLMASLNGVYIPGDNAYVLKNEKYMDTVARIMNYAITLSSATANDHWPVMAVSYGYIAALKGVQVRDSVIKNVPSTLLAFNTTLRIATYPFQSYLYHG
jgi:hypothetical protein